MALYVLQDFHEKPMGPSRILSQQFGLRFKPENLMTISALRPFIRESSYRPCSFDNKDSGSTVNCGKEKFEVSLDVRQYTPEEITVKVVDNNIVVEAKHEEKEDEHGFISRHFVRRYGVPKEYELKSIQSSLSSNGVLTIYAPKCKSIDDQERDIPVTQAGPHKDVKEKETKEDKQDGQK